RRYARTDIESRARPTRSGRVAQHRYPARPAGPQPAPRPRPLPATRPWPAARTPDRYPQEAAADRPATSWRRALALRRPLRGRVLLEPRHRPEPRPQPAVIRLDTVVAYWWPDAGPPRVARPARLGRLLPWRRRPRPGGPCGHRPAARRMP